ncbi:MAG: hypothetical protein LBP21_02730 [Synergistaceae bacterium]|jgi:hypothetical protein|nr:hypothetical protein [Synergistaceae bacterium]
MNVYGLSVKGVNEILFSAKKKRRFWKSPRGIAEKKIGMTVAEHQDIHSTTAELSDAALEKFARYIDFLRYEERMDELEDEEDIAYIEAHKDEGPNVPLSVVIAEYEAKYDPLG